MILSINLRLIQHSQQSKTSAISALMKYDQGGHVSAIKSAAHYIATPHCPACGPNALLEFSYSQKDPIAYCPNCKRHFAPAALEAYVEELTGIRILIV